MVRLGYVNSALSVVKPDEIADQNGRFSDAIGDDHFCQLRMRLTTYSAAEC